MLSIAVSSQNIGENGYLNEISALGTRLSYVSKSVGSNSKALLTASTWRQVGVNGHRKDVGSRQPKTQKLNWLQS